MFSLHFKEKVFRTLTDHSRPRIDLSVHKRLTSMQWKIVIF